MKEKGAHETVLVAVVGMSPAVLTETVWALAHERPPVIPDRIVAITTSPGKAAILEELLRPIPEMKGQTVWEALRNSLLGKKAATSRKLIFDEILVIGAPDSSSGQSRPLSDIRSVAENEAAADFILETVRRFTENPEIRLIASLAGGRKTLGTLLYASLCMLGRPEDRITHVLVPSEFEGPLRPKFYFPNQPEGRLKSPDGKTLLAKDAKPELADVPFICLRKLFPKEFGQFPGHFTSLVRFYTSRLGQQGALPSLKLVQLHPRAIVGSTEIPLAPLEHAFFSFLAERARQSQPQISTQAMAAEAFQRYLESWCQNHPELDERRGGAAWRKSLDQEDIKKLLSQLRRKFRSAGYPDLAETLFPRRGAVGFSYPIDLVREGSSSGQEERAGFSS
jgi:CRISPR-associated protein (TIGR02584 family)